MARRTDQSKARNILEKTRAVRQEVGGSGRLSKQGKSKTLEHKLNEEPVQGVRVVAAQSFGLARRRRVEVPVRHVAAARRGPRRPI